MHSINHYFNDFFSVHESYDAYICFPKETKLARDFVLKELVPKLEGEPYGLKFCLCERNVGPADHSLIAEVIVQRCKKFLLILSSGLGDGDRSTGTSFELDVALGNLSGKLDDTSLKKQNFTNLARKYV